MDQHQGNSIKVLPEQLGLLRITEEDVLEETTEYTDEMLVVLALATAYLKTGGGELHYFSKATEQQKQTIE